MKRVLIALLAIVALSGAVMATGPLFGISIEPATGSQASFAAGWSFDSWTLIGAKEAFDTWYGNWSICALWTPDWGLVDGRIGAVLGWEWLAGGLYYNDLAFVLGVQKFWGIPGVYAQFEIETATMPIPRVGFELVFDIPGQE